MATRVDIQDDTNNGIKYTGNWTTITNLTATSNEYNLTLHRTSQDGATFAFKYYGDRISIYGTLDSPAVNGYPNATFKLDKDGPEVPFNASGISGTVDGNSVTSHVLFYQSPSTSQEHHELNVTVHNVTEAGPFFYFDFLTFDKASIGSSVRYVLDDDDPAIVYGGSWTPGNRPGEYLGTHRQSSVSGGTNATLKFNGIGIQVFGTVPANQNPSTLVTFQLDSAPNGNFTPIASGTEVEHTLLYIQRDLPATDHELVISTVGAQSWAMDWIVIRPPQATSVIPTDSGSDPSSTEGAGENSSKGTNGGAIAGGVVGGLALLALIIVALWYIRRRKKAESALEQASVPPHSQFLDHPPFVIASPQPSQTATLGPADSTSGAAAGLIKPRKNEKSPRVVQPFESNRSLSLSNTGPGAAAGIGSSPGPNTSADTATVGGSSGGATPFSFSARDKASSPPPPSIRSHTGTTFTGTQTMSSPVRETDGGIRLDSGDEDGRHPVHNTLPPSYQQY